MVVEDFWCYTISFIMPCHCRPSLNTGTSAIFMVMFREPVCGALGLNLPQKTTPLIDNDGHFHYIKSQWRLLTFKSPSASVLLIPGYFYFSFKNFQWFVVIWHAVILDSIEVLFKYLSACFSAVSTDSQICESLTVFERKYSLWKCTIQILCIVHEYTNATVFLSFY